jgi:hypothetical protein
MRPIWISAFAAVLLAALPAPAGEVLDRIVASVNGHIILQSDWNDAVRFEALTNSKSIVAFTADERRATLERLVDQELLREQLPAAEARVAPDADAVTARLADLRKLYPEAASEPGWQTLLSHFDITEAELRARLALQLDLLRLVDDRLRPGTDVDDKAVEDYYHQSFLPELRKSGAADVPLADVSTKIRELLIQQKVNDSLADWLKSLREASTIRVQVGSTPQ